MSWENYERSMELAPKCRFYTTAGGRSVEEIEEYMVAKNQIVYEKK